MARKPRSKGGGIQIAIDTSELVDFAKKTAKAQKATQPVIAAGLNKVGDELVTVLSRNLAKQTGLGLDQVLGMFKVSRARRGKLDYEVKVNQKLIDREVGTLEGQRTIREFGTKEPDTLVVIVSKEDQLVCEDCTALAAAGPMPIEKAKAHIPAHPNCRCVIVPFVRTRRRLPVTMTSLTGTDPVRRAGVRPMPTPNADVTLRQLAESILNRTATTIRVQLS